MSELALKLIAENKKTRSPLLDLGNCGLTEVPKEIGELVWLEELSFASIWNYYDDKEWIGQKTQNTGPANKIARLNSDERTGKTLFDKAVKSSPFSNLIRLKKLYLNGEWSKEMEFNDLAPLAGLVNLQRLKVSFTPVADLTPLAGLVNLQRLDVSSTPVADLTPLAGLTQLQRLNVSSTPVADLTPLARLVNLQRLYIASTQVADLTSLAGLTQLQWLNVSSTQVADLYSVVEFIKKGLPVLWSSKFVGENGIYVENCPLTSRP